MKIYNYFSRKPRLALALGILLPLFSANGQVFTDPKTSATFEQATAGMDQIENYDFGTGAGKTVSNITQLAASFDPYGIAGTSNINSEWEVYQPFNTKNFVFTEHNLRLTATIPQGGGLF